MSNNGWSLSRLMQGLHERVEKDVKTAGLAPGHPVAKGDGSEAVWTTLFQKYLPKRYTAAKATIVDSRGKFMKVVGHQRSTDWPKLGPSLLIATAWSWRSARRTGHEARRRLSFFRRGQGT
jgi:hypothetical protein